MIAVKKCIIELVVFTPATDQRGLGLSGLGASRNILLPIYEDGPQILRAVLLSGYQIHSRAVYSTSFAKLLP